MEALHINQLPNKLAETIARHELLDDAYHNVIKKAAQELVESDRGQYRYLTQVGAGKTFWESPKGERIIL